MTGTEMGRNRRRHCLQDKPLQLACLLARARVLGTLAEGVVPVSAAWGGWRSARNWCKFRRLSKVVEI